MSAPENAVPLRAEGGDMRPTVISGPALVYVSDHGKQIYILDHEDPEQLARILLGRDLYIAAALVKMAYHRLQLGGAVE